MKFKPTLVALAIASIATASSAQIANGEDSAKTRYLTPTGVTAAWARGFTGKGSVIAIIDNGFDVNHADLKGNVLEFANFAKGTVTPWALHGTQMASIAAGISNNSGTVGVAPDAKLLLAQVGSGGLSPSVSTDLAFTAMAWAESKGANVINLSLGSTYDPNFKAGTTMIAPGIYKAKESYTTYNAKTGVTSLASLYGSSYSALLPFATATKKAVIVASAGNSATGYAQFPGAFATQTDTNGNLLMGGRVLIVGNVAADGIGGWVMNATSNQAGSLCTTIVNNVCQDKYYVKDFYVVAPGSAILGAVPDQARSASGIAQGVTNGAGSVSGTSPAAALVSGGVALLKQAWPQLSAAQIVQLVKTTATDLGKPGVDEVFGWGMVNFDKATQPQGLINIANFKGYASATPLASTGVASSGSASVNSSSVLRNVQGLDSYNRNYTLDMTKAVVANPVAAYRASSSYLAMSPQGYNEMSVPVTENYSIKMMQSQAGTASEVTYTEQGSSYSVQFGSMTEKSGFLGNYGAGAMAFGDSSTSYLQVGTEHKFGSVAVFGSYGFGTTRAGSVQDSMIQLGNRISSDTWKLGVAKNNVFQNKDSLSLSVVSPVSVRNGSATVTGVTGYEFTDNGDGADAKAIVSTETINLRAQSKPMDLVLGYTVIGKGYDRVNVNVARQFNVGGVAGNTANSFGVMAVKSF
jgi:hypothetical protein